MVLIAMMDFIAVLERYGQRLAPACGLLGGFGLNEGALAATVSHDSHNIVVIGGGLPKRWRWRSIR